MKPIRIGIVGAGSIGLRGALQHLSVGDYSDRVVAAAICDVTPGRAQAAADKFGVPQAFESYQQLLSEGDVDAVTICTPIGLHFEQGMQAIEAGKHVHFNKTMTVTLAEADALIARAAEKDVRLVASPGEVLRPHNTHIRHLIEDGALGQLIWAATGAGFGTYHEGEGVRQGDDVLQNIDPSWYWSSRGGGPLYDMTVYGLHALTSVLGPARRVTALSGIAIKERTFKGKTSPTGCDDNTLMLLEFDAALYAFVYGTAAGSLTPFGAPVFFGTKGSITGDKMNGQPMQIPGYEQAESGRSNSLLPHVTGQHAVIGEEAHVWEDIMQLVDWVREGISSPVTAEHARHVIDIIESAYRAAQTGQVQELQSTFALPTNSPSA